MIVATFQDHMIAFCNLPRWLLTSHLMKAVIHLTTITNKFITLGATDVAVASLSSDISDPSCDYRVRIMVAVPAMAMF